MKFERNVSFFAIIAFLTLSVFSLNAAAQKPVDKPRELPLQLLGDSIEGIWDLNVSQSDDPLEKIRAMIQKPFSFSDKAESNERTDVPPISISMFPPQRMVLASNKGEITVNEFYPDHISTRTRKTDGIPDVYQSENNVYVAVRATREENRLWIQTVSPRGNRMLETFEIFDNGDKMKVTIQISDSDSRELLTLQRIYDRAILDDLSDYN